MIDMSLPVEYERSDRLQAVVDGTREYRLCQPASGRRARLTVEEAAIRREEGALEAAGPAEAAPVVSVPSVPADPDVSLRHARIGFVAAAVLIMLLVWMMQRRKGR